MLVDASINGQWLSISHPSDGGSRRAGGGAGQVRGCVSRGEHQVSDTRFCWVSIKISNRNNFPFFCSTSSIEYVLLNIKNITWLAG